MNKVKLYTGTQNNQSINLWGEIATFDSDGMAEVSEDKANKAATSIPADYSLEPTNKKTGQVSSFSHMPAGDGVGKRAASVVEKEHKENLAAQKKAEEETEKEAEPVAEESKTTKATKKAKKKSSKKSKDKVSDENTEEAAPEETPDFPPNDENPKDSDSKDGKSGDIWK